MAPSSAVVLLGSPCSHSCLCFSDTLHSQPSSPQSAFFSTVSLLLHEVMVAFARILNMKYYSTFPRTGNLYHTWVTGELRFLFQMLGLP
ncbi:hypothetical protein STEG23_021715 [Scotinomys teguina]